MLYNIICATEHTIPNETERAPRGTVMMYMCTALACVRACVRVRACACVRTCVRVSARPAFCEWSQYGWERSASELISMGIYGWLRTSAENAWHGAWQQSSRRSVSSLRSFFYHLHVAMKVKSALEQPSGTGMGHELASGALVSYQTYTHSSLVPRLYSLQRSTSDPYPPPCAYACICAGHG